MIHHSNFIVFAGDESLDAGNIGSSGFARAVCPVMRQKLGTKGARFYVYWTSTDWGFGDRVECTFSSRRQENGVLVASGTKANVGSKDNHPRSVPGWRPSKNSRQGLLLRGQQDLLR